MVTSKKWKNRVRNDGLNDTLETDKALWDYIKPLLRDYEDESDGSLIIDDTIYVWYIKHTRHKNPINFMVNIIAGLIRYTYFEKKPSINFTENERALLLNAIDENSQNNGFKELLVVWCLSNSALKIGLFSRQIYL